MNRDKSRTSVARLSIVALLLVFPVAAWSQDNYRVFVSNEKSGDLTVISGAIFKSSPTSRSANVRAESAPARTEERYTSR